MIPCQISRATGRRRPALLSGTALAAAMALAGASAPAAAQGFNGTYTVDSGSATIDPTQSDITVGSSEAVITWQVTGATGAADVPFLGAGNTVLFHDPVSSGLPDYTVLNRVLPVDAGGGALAATISLAGTVNSTIGGQTGGNIWFYSPHGIVTNGSASFTVGSLLLTTSDIDQSSGSLYLSQGPGGNRIGFLAASDPNGTVRIGANTTIDAAGSANAPLAGYVGIFAPRIEQGGSVRAAGMIGYGAGEAGTMTFNAGLVDIAITQGTDESQHQGIVHTGTSGGPAVAAPTPRQIQMVAIPKNTALTMLLGGSIGFDAAAAVPDGSAVLLSAGWQPTTPPGEIAQGLGHMQVGKAVITGDPTLYATGTLTVAPGLPGSGLTRFNGITTFAVGQQLQMDAAAGTQVDFTTSLAVLPLRQFTGEDVRITTAGDPAGNLPAGQITVSGDLIIDATGQAAVTTVPLPIGADGVGGNVQVFIDQGALKVGGTLGITSNGFGQDGTTAGGSGLGGTIDLRVSGGGTIAVRSANGAGPLELMASGYGGAGTGDGAISGTGTGGVITLRDDGGLIDAASVTAYANGYGAAGSGIAPVAGDGLGGQIAVTIAGQAQAWDTLVLDASAHNGNPFIGSAIAGNALGNLGGAKLQVTGPGALTVGALTMANDAYVTTGGDSASTGTAGGLDLLVNAGGKLTVTGLTSLSASAINRNGNPQVGATMKGGILTATVDGAGSQWLVTNVAALADADVAGAGVSGGTATGGQAWLGATNGGLLQVSGTGPTGGPPQVRVGAVAHAGYGPVSSVIQGGDARIFVQGGTIDAATALLGVSAAAVGDGTPYDGANTGFDATGGYAALELLAGGIGAGSITAGSVVINAKGEAVSLFTTDPFGDFTGPFDSGNLRAADNGGAGTGGTAQLTVQAGTLTTGTIAVHANGLGGSASYPVFGPARSAGAGTGGDALVVQSGGSISATALDVLSEGRGGALVQSPFFDSPAPIPGVGRGGTARVTLSGGDMTLLGALSIAATAIGGAGADATGNSASATATAGAFADNSTGVAELLMPLGSSGASLTAASTSVSATAQGGAGGTDQLTGTVLAGGDALAGTARISLADGAISLGATRVDATATGGAGSTGGNATGGTAAFLLTDSLAAPATQRQTGALTLTASPIGGAGTTANGSATPGTTKLTVRAGRASSALVVNGNLAADAMGTVLAGDGFTGNLGGVPVQVNGDFTVATTRDINMSVDAGGGINATGLIGLAGQAITTTGTGVLSAALTASVQAATAINLGGLSAGQATLLQAIDPATLAPGPVSVASLSSGQPVTVLGSSVTIGSPGTLTFASASAQGGDLTITTTGDLIMPDTATTGSASLTAGGALHLAGTLSAANIALAAGTDILADAALTTLGTFSALAGGTYTGAVALTVPGNTAIDAAGGIALPSLDSGGTTLLRATGAPLVLDLTSAGPVTLAAQSATITSPGSLAFASATTSAGDLVIATAGTLALGSAAASGALDLTAGGLLSFAGPAEGATVIARSPDIAIGATGRLGRRGLTTTIQLINTAPFAGTFLGGTGQPDAWSLDAAEAARLYADQGVGVAPASQLLPAAVGPVAALGTVTIGNLALSYGTAPTANFGTGAQFAVTAPGAIHVVGPVAFATATDADTLSLSAQNILVMTDSGGSIALTGSGGNLLGTLQLSANSIFVGTASALSAVANLSSVGAVSDRLGANDGVVNDAGTLRAGSLEVAFGSRFFIQNSGLGTPFELRRGFAANSLAISTDVPTAQIAINGLLAGPPRLIGGRTQNGTAINGTLAAAGGPFDPLSTINGCVIGQACATIVVDVVPPGETLTGLTGPLGPGAGLRVLPVIQFGEVPLFDSPPLIDEPVTGVGNDDLWRQQ